MTNDKEVKCDWHWQSSGQEWLCKTHLVGVMRYKKDGKPPDCSPTKEKECVCPKTIETSGKHFDNCPTKEKNCDVCQKAKCVEPCPAEGYGAGVGGDVCFDCHHGSCSPEETEKEVLSTIEPRGIVASLPSWEDELEHWIKKQHGTAGWQMKLENFIRQKKSQWRAETMAEAIRLVEGVFENFIEQEPTARGVIHLQTKRRAITYALKNNLDK